LSERWTVAQLTEMATAEDGRAEVYGRLNMPIAANDSRATTAALRQAADDATIVGAINIALDRNGYVRILRPAGLRNTVFCVDDGTGSNLAHGQTLPGACAIYLTGGTKCE